MASPFIKRYLLALDRHKWVGVAGCAVVIGLSGITAFLQTAPENAYITQGILTYSAPPDTFSATGAVLKKEGQSMTKEMLLSTFVLGTTSDRLAKQNIQAKPKEIKEKAIVLITGGSSGEPLKEGETAATGPLRIVVTYKDRKEEKSKSVSIALIESMVLQSREFNRQQLNDIIQNLNLILPKVTGELQAAEKNLEAYIRLQGAVIQAAESGSLVGAITSNQQQQREIRLNLAGVEAQIRSLQSRLGLTPDQAYAASALSADPIIADLRARIYQARSQMSLLSKTLRPDHPSMVDLQSQLDSFDQLLQSRVVEVAGGGRLAAPLAASSQILQASSLDPARQQLASTLVSLQTQSETLRQQFGNLLKTEQELKQDYSNIPNKQLGQKRLEQQVALKQAFYDQVQAKLADVTLAQQETVGSLVLIQDPETVAEVKPGTSSLVILIVGSMMGVFIGAGLVLLLDAIDPKIYTLEDLQNALRQQDVPILGLLPYLPWEEEHVLPIIEEAGSPYLEPFERLRSNLRRTTGGETLKIVMLTSIVGGEGKTTAAYNLAIASARAGKRTLLIEADLRSPSRVASFGIILDPDSLVEPLHYYGNLNECIRLVPGIENLYIVPSVGSQRQAAAVLESSEMRRLIEDGRGRFDWVILDAPPLSRCNDALLLEPYTDGMVLVTRPGHTEESLLIETAQQFVESETVRFLGAIITDTDIPIQAHDLLADSSLNLEEGSEQAVVT
ncbi:MAG: AAA family ATPase [Timaviella obliquedivisa GSE-PSE-MK23-08B]|nr:AAA family ATPase [Timaviella obliquedivisa GSE-PSE-MK23-08B]